MKQNKQILKTIFFLLFVPGIIQLNANNFKPGASRGPLYIRNQFPVGLQFLAFSAVDAYLQKENTWNLKLYYSHSNTFVRLRGVFSLLDASAQRQDFNRSTAEQLIAVPDLQNPYFIDSGLGRLNISMSYAYSDNLNFGFELPFYFYSGGFLDAPIESFHQLVGYPFTARAMIRENESRFFIGGNTMLYRDSQNLSRSGPGDLTLWFRHKLLTEQYAWPAVAIQLALKLPSGDTNSLKGSGSVDYGVNLSATKSIGRSYITSNLYVIKPGKWQIAPAFKLRPIYSWLLVYEYQWVDNLSIILQNQILTSPLDPGEYTGLTKPSFEWSIGGKFDVTKRLRLALAITENYLYHENTPDFGFHLGMELFF